MPYDNERSVVSAATGLTGVEAGHIVKKLAEIGVDPQSIDWEGAISDARDYGDRYSAVKQYIANYYGVDVDSSVSSVSGFDVGRAKHEEMMDLVSTKKGVKAALKMYFYSNSKKEKESIREMLLGEAPLYNVLMTSMYDGEEMPLARRFLNENMGNGNGTTNGTAIVPMVNVPVKSEIAKTVSYKRPASSVDIRDLYNSLMKEESPAISSADPVQKKKEREYLKKVAAAAMGIAPAIVRERDIWGNVLRGSMKSAKPTGTEKLRREVKMLQARNAPLRLQMEKQKLLMQREQMIALQRMQQQSRPPMSPQDQFLAAFIGFVPPQERGVLSRPGYHIEARHKLPPGYRWKKTPKRKTKGR